MWRFGVVDQDFVQKQVLRIDEAGLEEVLERGVDAADDLGVGDVLL